MRQENQLGVERAVQRPSRRSSIEIETEALRERAGGERFLDRARSDDVAVAQQQRVREASRDLIDVVGDEHQWGTGGVERERAEPGDEVFARAEVEACGRLVEQQRARDRP